MRRNGPPPSGSTAGRAQPDAARRLEEQGRRICLLAQEASSAEDLETALRVLTELRNELHAFERLHVGRGLAAGRSFGELARVLGISRQAAHRRYRALAPRRPAQRGLGATALVRHVVRLARAEACAAGLTAIGSRELLLAILQTDTDAARALHAEGVTLARVRGCAPPAGEIGDPDGLRGLFRCAGRLALTRGDRALGPGHLVAAMTADPRYDAVRALTALGAAPAAVRARLGY